MPRLVLAAFLIALGTTRALALSGAVTDTDDAYPYVVELNFRKHLICSGTLLYPRIVVTAAHCVTRVVDARARLFADDTLLVSQLTVVVTRDGKSETYPAADIILPPHWREVVDKPNAAARYAYDLALIVTKQPIDVAPPLRLKAATQSSSGNGVMVGFGADTCSANRRCGHAGTRRYRQVALKDAVDCFDEAIEAHGEPGSAKIAPALASHLSRAVWCTDWGVMPGDSGGPLLVEGPGGALIFAGVISAHWGSYAAQVQNQEADKRSFASSLYPSLDFIAAEASKLGYAP